MQGVVLKNLRPRRLFKTTEGCCLHLENEMASSLEDFKQLSCDFSETSGRYSATCADIVNGDALLGQQRLQIINQLGGIFPITSVEVEEKTRK